MKTSTKKTVKSTLPDPMKTIKWVKAGTNMAFHFLAGINRKVHPGHVSKLCNSLNKMGIIRPVVISYLSFIDGVRRPYIIDGQHLINAAMRVGVEIPYITIDIKDQQDLVEKIALLNASSKSWALLDYIQAWASLKEDYKKLEKYFNVYDIEINILGAVLIDQVPRYNAGGNGCISKIIKNGTFKIINEEQNVKLLDQVTDFLNIMPRGLRSENRYACSEYITFVKTTKNYNHEVFLKKLKAKVSCIQFAINEKGKLVTVFKNL